ncbi:putative NTF2-like domain-containing protein [Rosa chinensis]|uniref:Putative NTF2-like domain-containing protein n=1 Tax=Rosa chinensis TaxID=74649 RepID=A0A2P6PSD0_ROSCH|nr:pathogen-related protein-like [Rosa chinensis]PRQ24838.1 putative NTF2-like domain-containing protein [Rosa chinensis]
MSTSNMEASGVDQRDKYRSYMYGDGERNTQWRAGAPPNYDVVNKLFEEGRTKIWPTGSLEERVQNLLKTYEMEISHKANPQDFKSIDPEKFTFVQNGKEPLTIEDITKMGGVYNVDLQSSLPEEFQIYKPAEETAESSHKLFTTTFPRGFAIEVLEVYSGPPVIAYKFRHWSYMEGPFKGYAPTGELVQFFGIAIFRVDEQMRIVKVEFFYDPAELLGGLTKGAKIENCGGNGATKSSCPILRNK